MINKMKNIEKLLRLDRKRSFYVNHNNLGYFYKDIYLDEWCPNRDNIELT